MNEEFEKKWDQLRRDVTSVHVTWLLYRQLYAASEETIELMNRNGSNVFYLLQFLIIDDVSLVFSKLTDPLKQGKFENLSLCQVLAHAEQSGDEKLLNDLTDIFNALMDACVRFRAQRNKRIAHADLANSLEIAEEPLPGISREYVENALQILRDFMNRAELFYKGSQTAYEMTIIPYASDGKKLLKALRNAEKYAEVGDADA